MAKKIASRDGRFLPIAVPQAESLVVRCVCISHDPDPLHHPDVTPTTLFAQTMQAHVSAPGIHLTATRKRGGLKKRVVFNNFILWLGVFSWKGGGLQIIITHCRGFCGFWGFPWEVSLLPLNPLFCVPNINGGFQTVVWVVFWRSHVSTPF